MNTVITPGIARGTVAAPPSKSMAHRLLITAALAQGESVVSGVDFSQDILATIDCLRAMGAAITVDEQASQIYVCGTDPRCGLSDDTVLKCRESGSTIRFMIPLALLSGTTTHFTGKGRLMERPMTIYRDICAAQSLLYRQDAEGIAVRGPLQASEFSVPGDISSQFITGLMLALPLLRADSRITLTTPLESRPYIDLTLAALAAAGIRIEAIGETGYYIAGNQEYTPFTATVEGDYSNAAFIEALNLLGGQVDVTGLSENSKQGDRVYRTYFRQMKQGMPTLDIHDCPDLAPILMTMGAALHGVHLQGTRRLKIKESDRGVVMTQELAKFGANITVMDDDIIVNPAELHKPTEELEGHNDHRIVMSLAILATKFGGKIIGSQAVTKSYPNFFDMLRSVGIAAESESD